MTKENPCRCGRDRYSGDGECIACPPISTVIFCGQHEDGEGPTQMEFTPDKTTFTCTLCGQWVATMHKSATVS